MLWNVLGGHEGRYHGNRLGVCQHFYLLRLRGLFYLFPFNRVSEAAGISGIRINAGLIPLAIIALFGTLSQFFINLAFNYSPASRVIYDL